MGLTGYQAADEVLRLGETTPELVEAAASAAAELVRRLNHATFHREALPWPSSVGTVAGQLNAALWGIEQLLGQLAARLQQFAADPCLSHDEHRDDQAVAADAAAQAAEWLREAASARWTVTGPLEQALRLVSHLGMNVQ